MRERMGERESERQKRGSTPSSAHAQGGKGPRPRTAAGHRQYASLGVAAGHPRGRESKEGSSDGVGGVMVEIMVKWWWW